MKTKTKGKILCGTDFSKNAVQASRTAALLAAHTGRSLTLLHASSEPTGRLNRKKRARVLETANRRMQRELAQASDAGATKVKATVTFGETPGRAIVSYTAHEHPELVVVSSLGKSAFDRWTLGSVSETVAQEAPAPTLVIRDAKPFDAWLQGERALKVFVALDDSACSDHALSWVGDLQKTAPCEITLGFINWPPEEQRRLGVKGPRTFLENLPEVQTLLENEVKTRAERILGDSHFTVQVVSGWGRADHQILELANQANADLLVVGTHQRSGFARWRHGSTSRGILRNAALNVACVPETPGTTPPVRACQRVLAAIDLNHDNDQTIAMAYSVAGQDGTVILTNIAPEDGFVRDLETAGKRALHRKNVAIRHAQSITHLRAMIPETATERGLKTEIDVRESDQTVQAICEAAEAYDADLVCIGSSNRPGPLARILGSVALGVLQHCRRPVLIVWPEK